MSTTTMPDTDDAEADTDDEKRLDEARRGSRRREHSARHMELSLWED